MMQNSESMLVPGDGTHASMNMRALECEEAAGRDAPRRIAATEYRSADAVARRSLSFHQWWMEINGNPHSMFRRAQLQIGK
jgi:hypothetical protein